MHTEGPLHLAARTYLAVYILFQITRTVHPDSVFRSIPHFIITYTSDEEKQFTIRQSSEVCALKCFV